MNIKTRRVATVIRVGNSSTVVLSEEFESLGIKNGDKVLVSVVDDKIEIVRGDFYYKKFRKEAKKG